MQTSCMPRDASCACWSGHSTRYLDRSSDDPKVTHFKLVSLKKHHGLAMVGMREEVHCYRANRPERGVVRAGPELGLVSWLTGPAEVGNVLSQRVRVAGDVDDPL